MAALSVHGTDVCGSCMQWILHEVPSPDMQLFLKNKTQTSMDSIKSSGPPSTHEFAIALFTQSPEAATTQHNAALSPASESARMNFVQPAPKTTPACGGDGRMVDRHGLVKTFRGRVQGLGYCIPENLETWRLLLPRQLFPKTSKLPINQSAFLLRFLRLKFNNCI